MRRVAPRLARAAAIAASALACGQGDAPRYAAPAQERAALVLEPPQVALGGVADVVLTVVTHPGASIAPAEAPGGLQGLQLVEREVQPVQKEASRWLHRTRLRIRAVDVGTFEFPGGEVAGESAEGAALAIPYAALPIEVASSLGGGPERRTPFGLRRLPAARVGGAGAALAFATGAAVALGGVGVVALARRRRAERRAQQLAAASEVPGTPAWEIARAALDLAGAQQEADPRAALDAASRALRRYAAARYDADIPPRSVEELRVAQPPYLMTTRWSGFVDLLAALDVARFAPRPAAERAARASELLRAARSFVDETTPPEARR
jgi:hypothetical protein